MALCIVNCMHLSNSFYNNEMSPETTDAMDIVMRSLYDPWSPIDMWCNIVVRMIYWNDFIIYRYLVYINIIFSFEKKNDFIV